MSKIKIGSSKYGHVLEYVEYEDIIYHRKWESGEFQINESDKVINSTGDVSLNPETLLRVSGDLNNIVYWEDPINLVDGEETDVDPTSDEFRESSTIKEYWIVDGYEITELKD